MNFPVCALVVSLAALAAAPQPALAQADPNPATASEANTPPDIFDVIERGRQAILAGRYEDAGNAIEEALTMPEFAQLPTEAQYRVLLFAAHAATGRDDLLGAHEFAVLVTQFPQADSEDWLMRAQRAAWIEAWSDTGVALTTVVQRWPKALGPENADLVRYAVARMNKDNKHAAERLALINALYEADFKMEWGIEPSWMWSDLVADALDRNDLARARKIVKRINHMSPLIEMRINKRFDALLKAEPKSFDIRAVAQRHSKALLRASGSNPRSLGVLVEYGYALMAIGEFEKLLNLTNDILGRVASAPEDKPPYDDLKDKINWIHDHKHRALRYLGRWDEALAVMQAHVGSDTQRSDYVSQAINLASFLNDLGKPDQALAALEGIDWARSLSPYGRMALQLARYRACLQQGDADEAETILAYLRANKDESLGILQTALLDSGDLDAAAEVLIARLRDVEDRGDALMSVQDYLHAPRLPREIEESENWRVLLARPDVTAAIDAVGRRESIPIYSLIH